MGKYTFYVLFGLLIGSVMLGITSKQDINEAYKTGFRKGADSAGKVYDFKIKKRDQQLDSLHDIVRDYGKSVDQMLFDYWKKGHAKEKKGSKITTER